MRISSPTSMSTMCSSKSSGGAAWYDGPCGAFSPARPDGPAGARRVVRRPVHFSRDVTDAAGPSTPTDYPAHWEADVLLRDGRTAHLRPIRPEDKERLVELLRPGLRRVEVLPLLRADAPRCPSATSPGSPPSTTTTGSRSCSPWPSRMIAVGRYDIVVARARPRWRSWSRTAPGPRHRPAPPRAPRAGRPRERRRPVRGRGAARERQDDPGLPRRGLPGPGRLRRGRDAAWCSRSTPPTPPSA